MERRAHLVADAGRCGDDEHVLLPHPVHAEPAAARPVADPGVAWRGSDDADRGRHPRRRRRSSRVTTRTGPRPFLVVGPLLAGTGLLWLSFLDAGSNYWTGVLPGSGPHGLSAWAACSSRSAGDRDRGHRPEGHGRRLGGAQRHAADRRHHRLAGRCWPRSRHRRSSRRTRRRRRPAQAFATGPIFAASRSCCSGLVGDRVSRSCASAARDVKVDPAAVSH
ncbi:hypothetical protein ACU686_01045 [Yinghuangia aomiensis]